MIDMIVYYWEWMLAILVISGISSFWSSKLGTIMCVLITLASVALTVLLAIGGVPGTEYFLVLGLFLFPALSWAGFLIGKYLKKRCDSNLENNQGLK
jgi:hypothetical protein